MIRTACAAAMILIAAPSLADQVTFTCELTGGGSQGKNGFDIYSEGCAAERPQDRQLGDVVPLSVIIAAGTSR